MEEKKYMTIDGLQVEINGEKNVLEVARKAGIDIPAFCYDPELSIYGACRMCMVDTGRGLDASCSMQPREGMVINTNTPKLRKYRKMILELLLSNHCRDCTVCPKSNDCRLQDFAKRYGLTDVRFPNTNPTPKMDTSSLSITRDASKCILCGKCVRVCNEIQNVGAIDYGFRSSKMKIVTVFDGEIANSPCVGCGQCAAVCPTGAIVVKNDAEKVWTALADENTEVSVQVAPAVRVALGKELGLAEGQPLMGKLITALRGLGFDRVYDTSIGADMTIIEEGNELIDRLQNNGKFPMFTSCCPAWIRYAERNFADKMENISSCKSPMEMLASVIKHNYTGEKKHFHVAIMPCTAKKFEAAREEFAGDVDAVLSTQEIISMIKTAGIRFAELADGTCDNPLAEITGGAVIFGVTGGVTEAALRYVANATGGKDLEAIAYCGVRGLEGVKEATVTLGDRTLKIAVVSGLKNTDTLIRKMDAGEIYYDFVEVMTCPGGCINGGGQPRTEIPGRIMRSEGLYTADADETKRASHQNKTVTDMIAGLSKEEEHKLFHVHYHTK